jgi:hypothetical protein
MEAQITLAERLSYLSQGDAGRLLSMTSENGKMINGLIRTYSENSTSAA